MIRGFIWKNVPFFPIGRNTKNYILTCFDEKQFSFGAKVSAINRFAIDDELRHAKVRQSRQKIITAFENMDVLCNGERAVSIQVLKIIRP